MKHSATQYKRHRFPPEVIQHAVWLYYRFNLSHRDIEDLLARRGILVTHESILLWCNKFGPRYAAAARRFIRHLLSRLGGKPRTIVTDRLGSYAVARRELMPGTLHDTRRYANNRAELSH